ncbi:MAG TPA: nucleoside hydrolase [Jiangellales bacterium]|nr:nucleoside hydrolase [Jiangellales bacterium]
MVRPVTLVVDTGVDDALALVVAARHPALDLHAVVATAGNASLGRVLANTTYVLDLLDLDVPVAAGVDRPLDGTAYPVRAVHGPDGLGGWGPGASPDPATFPSAGTLLGEGAATIVSLGPLTVVALVLGRVDPTENPVRVVASCAAAGEANHAMDPEAADLLARAGVPVSHDGGPGFGLPVPDPTVARALAASTDRAAALVGRLLAHQVGRGAGIGDAGTILRLAEPGIRSATAVARLVQLAGG